MPFVSLVTEKTDPFSNMAHLQMQNWKAGEAPSFRRERHTNCECSVKLVIVRKKKNIYI